VNHNSVTIDSNGNYYIYLDLKKGQNTIEVKTVTGTETNTDNINIFFDPPLAIQLNFPNFDPNTDLKIPTTITGVVSNPTADVTVNGKKVDVKTDGSFTAQILSVKGKNHVDAIATSNNDNDETYLNWTRLDNGQLGYDLIPTSGPYTRPTVTLKAGESTSFDFVTQINTTISELNSLAVIRTEQLGDERTSLPILPDLIVSIEPSTFTAYRRIEYHSQITIKTSPGLKPRDYYFIISPSFGNMADFIISIK
jgi:biopolymer transport protein ExbD